MTKVVLSLRTWVAACVHKPKHAYTSIFLHTQLGFQKYKKIMAEVWNESHIVWESFQTPFFPLYKALYGTFSKYIENSQEKRKIH